MYPIMNECIKRLIRYFDNVANRDGLISPKEVMSGFTIDVISLSAFATNTDANNETRAKNPFLYHGLNLFKVMLSNSNTIQIFTIFNFVTIV